MKPLILILCLLVGGQASAATQSTKFQSSFSRSQDSLKEARATIGTNIADLSQNRLNAQVGVFLSPRLAAALSYSNMSERMVRDNTTSRSRFTVDRTHFGIGTDFYWKPVSAVYNAALSPSFIFQNERDAFTTDSSTGVGLRAMGIYKPLPRLMAQGGIASSMIGSSTKADLLLGMGLFF